MGVPPIRLAARLPLDYPSHSAPEITLSCSWLSVNRLAKLVEELEKLWSDNQCEILFIWSSFLKDQSLETLRIVDSYDLIERYPMHFSQEGNQRTLVYQSKEKVAKENADINNSGLLNETSVEGYEKLDEGKDKLMRKGLEMMSFHMKELKNQLYLLMIEHNAEKCREEFNNQLQDCNVCFSSQKGECCKKLGCGHITCIECLKRMLEVHLKEGTVECIICPEDSCGHEIPTNLIQELLSKELFDKYDQLMLNRTLDEITNMTYCPIVTCQYPVTIDDKESGIAASLAICPSCSHAFCVYCKKTYHGIESCKMDADKKLELVESYLRGSYKQKLELEKIYGKKQVMRLVSDAETEMWISKNSKKCPCCHTNIEKRDGCNKMICSKCNANFCWICETRLCSLNPYLHYQQQNTKCFNLLFEGIINNNDLLED